MPIILGILEEGLVYAIMALGVYITYKILDFPDLSVDGTFPLGAAVTAAGIAGGFLSPVAALFVSFLAGARHYCHDSPLFHQSEDHGKSESSDFQQGNYFFK